VIIRQEVVMAPIRKEIQADSLDPSSAILIAEHERVASLHKHNVEMGDRYMTTYIALFSALIILMIGIIEFGDLKIDQLLSSELVILLTMLSIGLITFKRLIDRRVRHIEYLRAINRIHAHFAARDPQLSRYFYWPVQDDHPPLSLKGTILGGIMDIVGLLDSVVIGLIVILVSIALVGESSMLLPMILGFVTASGSVYLHYRFKLRAFRAAEGQMRVNFPSDEASPG
jgi:small-conductance mechanosensitive channel